MTLEESRERMISEHLIARGIRNERVLMAMRSVPRHLFVEPALRPDAYSDQPLPIGQGQTISQPYIVALMTEALKLNRGEKVLEIGTGSGYQAAVLDAMGCEVYSVERFPELAEAAALRLRELGYAHVHIRVDDGNEGWPDAAPFDAAIVTAAAREIPRNPLWQLRDGGRMVLPVGDPDRQELVVIWRAGSSYREQFLGGCRFVKLSGKHGWND